LLFHDTNREVINNHYIIRFCSEDFCRISEGAPGFTVLMRKNPQGYDRFDNQYDRYNLDLFNQVDPKDPNFNKLVLTALSIAMPTLTEKPQKRLFKNLFRIFIGLKKKQ